MDDCNALADEIERITGRRPDVADVRRTYQDHFASAVLTKKKAVSGAQRVAGLKARREEAGWREIYVRVWVPENGVDDARETLIRAKNRIEKKYGKPS